MCSKAIKNLDKWNKFAIIFCLIQTVSAERNRYQKYYFTQLSTSRLTTSRRISLANHKSALKRAKQNEIQRIRNKGYKTKVKKAVKEVRTALTENTPAQAKETLVKAISLIQKSASKGVIHKNQAARKVSRLTLQVNKLSASESK